MSKIIISNDTSKQITIDADHTDLLVVEGYNVAVADTFAIYNAKYDNTHMTINGHIDVLSDLSYAVISTYGTHDEIEIGKTGTIKGPRGIQLNGDDQTVINHGTVNGADYGIAGGDGGLTVVNTGKIVSAQGYAVALGDGADTVVNRGTITGSLETGDGADHIDLRHGFVDGGVFGGDGNDIYTLSKTYAASLYDSSGYDMVRTTASFTVEASQGIEVVTAIGHRSISLTGNDQDNNLGGNAGNNTISAGGGEDFLGGGAGHDILTGSLDSDTFYFRAGHGKDVITDFEFGGMEHDRIYLAHIKGVHTFADIQDHMSNDHGDTILDFGHGDRLTVLGVKPGEFGMEDFRINGHDLI